MALGVWHGSRVRHGSRMRHGSRVRHGSKGAAWLKGCGIAQLAGVRRLAVRQARVRFSARAPHGGSSLAELEEAMRIQ